MLLIIFSLIFSCISCNTTEPDIKPPVEPDSTTQNFNFETFEFGNGLESNELNDVWIFDENNIWAVGYIRDTTTNNLAVNIIRWNGQNWFGFGNNLTSSGLTGIWASDTNNVYLASGALRKYENGAIKVIDLIHLTFSTGQAIYKLWGSSENNIWGIGPNSTIVHFDGVAWSKIAFDDGWRFDAITGSKQTGIAYASATSQQFNTIIVELNNNSATIIYNSVNDPDNLTSFSIKLLDEEKLILGDKKVWTYNIHTKVTNVLYTFPTNGDFINLTALYNKMDIYFFADKYGPGEILLHYNGKRFTSLIFSNRNSVIYGGAYAIKDLAVMTGFSNNKGYLVKVTRQ
ncbi:MAG: hypothetical protein ABI638_10680 [Ignavibacteriota bacterium]